MSMEIYRPGSDVTPLELNTFQDDYADTGFSSWKTVAWVRFGVPDTVAAGTYNLALGKNPFPRDLVAGITTGVYDQHGYIDPANDWPDGVATRTGSLRMRFNLNAGSVAPGSRVTGMGLYRVSGVDGSGNYTWDASPILSWAPVGSIAAEQATEYVTSTVGYSGFTAGSYGLRTVVGSAVADSHVFISAQLQRREL